MSDGPSRRESEALSGNLWTETAGEPPTFPPLEDEIVAEVAVIGAGVTGLSAALHLAEAGRRTVVIEQGELAGGATRRAGGQVLAGVKLSPESVEEKLGATSGRRLVAWTGGAADLVFDLVARWRIDCAAERRGSIQAAYTRRELRELRHWSQQWRERGADVRDLDRRSVAKLLGTPLYLGGILDARGGSLHPLRYAFGLARAAGTAGADFHLRNGVRRLQRHQGKWHLQLQKGIVLCDHVVVATNAYSCGLLDGLADSIVAMPASQVATRQLSQAILQEILPGRQVASDRRRMLVSFRISPCGRLLLGGPGGTGEALGRNLKLSAERTAREVFGHLGPFQWEYGWTGHVALVVGPGPHLHEPEPGLHVALGFNGQGLALGTALGKVVAERINGRAADSLPVPVTPIRRIPLARLAPRAVTAGERLLGALDRLERALNR